MLADKAYDSNAIRDLIESQGAVPNIPPKANRRWKSCFSKSLYKDRNAVDIDQTWRLSRLKVRGTPAFRRRQAVLIGRPCADGLEAGDRGHVSRHQLDDLGAHFDRAVA